MHIKLVLLSCILFLFSACIGEPAPNEFSKMRQQMQERQDRMFLSSVKNLENRNNSKGRAYRGSEEMDSDEKLRRERKEERKEWQEAGIEPEEAKEWKALGLLPKKASSWKKTGLSYNTIGVLIKQNVEPSDAVAFMNRKFDKSPKVFGVFSQPLYEFKTICKNILNGDNSDLPIINKQCADYVQLAEFSSVSGYMADEYKDNDLVLEYIAQLREMDSQKAYIQKLMEKKLQESMVHADTKTYTLLFPVIQKSPTRKEMFFIAKHKLPLQGTKRYKSHKYYAFWTDKEKKEEKARLAVIKHQSTLKKTKKERAEAEEHNRMVALECGEIVTPHPSTDEKVHIEGKIEHVVGKLGTNIFAYVIKSKIDGKKYLVRDPNSTRKVNMSEEVSWTALTVGRVVSITVEDDGTAMYNHYEEEAKEYFPMLKFLSTCAYNTK